MDELFEDPQPVEAIELWGDGILIPPPAETATGPGDAIATFPTPAPGPGDRALDYAEPWTEDETPPEIAAPERALDGRFIVEEEVEGDRAPNSITEEEYREMVALYAGVAGGESDLVLGSSLGDDEQFRRRTLGDIASILQSPSGRDLLRQLHDNVERDEAGNPISEPRTTTLSEAGRPSGAQTLPLGDVVPGVGVDAATSYKPGRYIETPNGNVRSDVVLFHELRHAFDVTGGTLAEGEIEPGPGIPDEDVYELLSEHQAIGLGAFADDEMTENGYRADRNEIAKTGIGVLEGDAEMPQRESYTQFIW